MPRVSRPALPASERKHGLCAVSLIGSRAASRICSRTVLVSEISLVLIRVLLGALIVTATRDGSSVASTVDPEHVVLELRQLTCAFENFTVDDVGRVALGVAMLLRLHVEHELRQCPMQACCRAAQEGEARAAQLGAGVEVDAERGADVGMVARREVEGPRRAVLADFGIGGLVGAHRHAVVRQVGQAHQQAGDLGLHRLVACRRGGKLVAEAADFGHDRGHVATLGLELADLLAQGIAPGLQFFGARLDVLALGFERSVARRGRERVAATCAFRVARSRRRGHGAAG